MYADTIETTHARPAWLLLSPAATRFVREHEKPHPHPLHCIWRCNHCAHHFEQQTSQADVVAHVTNVYVDFFISSLMPSTQTVFVIQSLYQESSYWCRYCRRSEA
jgi:hypothetical protein